MTLTDQHIRALTFLACDIRKQTTGARQWDPGKVFDQITALRNRPLVSVQCAVARCAADRNVKREEAISSAGSHWGDTMLPAAFVPNRVEPADECSICAKPRHAPTNHEFDSRVAAAQRKSEGSTEAAAAAIAALKAERAATPKRTPAPAQGLEALAERDPKLRARVEAVRAAMPAPMGLQESEPTSEGASA